MPFSAIKMGNSRFHYEFWGLNGNLCCDHRYLFHRWHCIIQGDGETLQMNLNIAISYQEWCFIYFINETSWQKLIAKSLKHVWWNSLPGEATMSLCPRVGVWFLWMTIIKRPQTFAQQQRNAKPTGDWTFSNVRDYSLRENR